MDLIYDESGGVIGASEPNHTEHRMELAANDRIALLLGQLLIQSENMRDEAKHREEALAHSKATIERLRAPASTGVADQAK